MTTGVASVSLVGRRNEIQLLSERLEQARAGRGGWITVSAEPGSGKTALMDAVAGFNGCSVLRCRGLEAEVELPFSGLQQLLTPLADRVSELPERQGTAVTAATSLRGDHGVSAIDVALGTLTLIAQAAAEHPVALLVDDLHWIDPATLQVLTFVVPRLSYDPVLAVMTTRDARECPLAGGEHLQLEPLSAAETTALAEQHAGRPLLAPTATAIFEATGGNPLAVVEAIRLHGDDLDRLGTAMDEPLQASALIELGFEKRLAALPPSARAALSVVATALTDSADVIERAATTLGLPDAVLDPAEEQLLINREPGTITFAHPLLRARVYHAITPVERRRINGALAKATSAPGLSAWHAGAASLEADENLAAALESAAAEFQTRGGHLASARAFERAARLSPSEDDRARRLMEAGRLALVAGRMDWAAECFAEATELTSDRALKLRIAFEGHHIRVGRGDHGGGGPEGMLQLAERALPFDRDLARGCFATAINLFSVVGDVGRALEITAQLESLGQSDDPGVAARTVAATATFFVMSGSESIRGRDLLIADAQRRLRPDQPLRDADVIIEGLVWVEEFELADALFVSTLERARVSGDVSTELNLLSVDGYRRFRTGEWTRADQAIEQACRLSEAAGERYQVAISLATLAIVHGSRGDDQTTVLCDEVAVLAERHAYDDLEPHLRAALGVYHLSRGRAQQALVPLEAMEAWCQAGGYREPGIFSWQADLVDAYALADRHTLAEQALERLRQRSASATWIWPRATIARLEGTLAASGNYDACFASALELFARLPSPFDRGRTHLQYGRRLRRDGRRSAALEHLTLAAEAFTELAAVGWLEQTTAELSALGASARDPAARRTVELTRQEQAVASCIAQGMTNKEAAAQLFLTPKTIEWHLRQIYRKLDIKSRTQLAAWMHTLSAR